MNGSSEILVAKKVGGLNIKTASRRYDIEFRTQYFYYQQGEEFVSVAISIPMFFVQEEQQSTLASDITSSNKNVINSFALIVAATDINKIKDDYDTLIDGFIEKKDKVSAQKIIDFIGSKYI